MKIGILSDCFGLGFLGGIQKAQDLGVDGVQLYAVSGELAPENMSKKARREAKHLIWEHGLEISAICGDLGSGGFALKELNPSKIARTKEIVDLSLDLGCSIITTHIGVVPHDISHPRFQVIAEALYILGSYANSCGAVFAIETGPEPAKDLRRIIDYVHSPGIGVNFDPANLRMCFNSDSAEDALVLGEKIVHTHAKDGKFLAACDMDIMYGMIPAPEDFEETDYCIETSLGEGDVDFPKYLSALRQISYDGYLTIEREVGAQPEKDIALAVQFLKKCIDR